MRRPIDKKLLRIIDANLNRVKEGLRVCEDICRFFYNRETYTRRYKDIRHELTSALGKFPVRDVILERDIRGDVGRRSSESEFRRKDADDLFYANSQRVKESLRVLEECMKILDHHAGERLKRLRYKIYALEQSVVKYQFE